MSAYKRIDISKLPAELGKAIVSDSMNSGELYGVRVVEQHINGPVSVPIYGYYTGGDDELRWAETKVKYGIDDEVDGEEAADSVAASAAKEADAAAAAVREAEDKAIEEVVKPTSEGKNKLK